MNEIKKDGSHTAAHTHAGTTTEQKPHTIDERLAQMETSEVSFSGVAESSKPEVSESKSGTTSEKFEMETQEVKETATLPSMEVKTEAASVNVPNEIEEAQQTHKMLVACFAGIVIGALVTAVVL